VRCGAALHDALGQEPELRDARARAVAGHLDTAEVERGVMEAIAQVCAQRWWW
jgi:clusterin-associated protein 1